MVMRILMMMTVMLMMVTQWDNEDENDNDVIVSTSLFAGDDNLPQCQTQLPETENRGGHRTAGVEQDGLQSCGCAEASLRLVAFGCPWWLSGFQSWTAAHAVVGSKPRQINSVHGLFCLSFLYCPYCFVCLFLIVLFFSMGGGGGSVQVLSYCFGDHCSCVLYLKISALLFLLLRCCSVQMTVESCQRLHPLTFAEEREREREAHRNTQTEREEEGKRKTD